MIRLSSNNVYVLFDPCTTHFFILTSLVRRNNELSIVSLEIDLCVSTPSGDVILVNSICKGYIMGIEDRVVKANLIILEMKDFDVIFGMD